MKACLLLGGTTASRTHTFSVTVNGMAKSAIDTFEPGNRRLVLFDNTRV